ncbi:caspase family protein [bacterium]|nr:caspase family protein [bacterium]
MKKILLFIVSLILVQPAFSYSDSYVRLGLFIGENYGSVDDVPLRYAGQDARRFYRVMEELGGLSQRKSRLLIDCNLEDILFTLDDLHATIAELKASGEKVIFFFFYSGHADDKAMHINGELLTFDHLKSRLADCNADIHFGIFDTCQSGAITKIKGGYKGHPFTINLVEESDISGSVYLTSSMAEEVSHESEAYSSSLFTYYLVSALRGAADFNDDKRISLTEVYRYAYVNTLRASSETTGIVQHPNYQINLRGRGELILTYLPSSPVHIIFPGNIAGDYYISSEETGELFVEVRAKAGEMTRISLPRGSYVIKKKRENDLLIARVNLHWGGDYIVQESNMQSVLLTAVRHKGTSYFQTPKNSFFFLTANGSGMYEGMGSLPQVGFGFSRKVTRYELGFSLSYSEQDFVYENIFPSTFSSFNESIFLHQQIPFFPLKKYLTPIIGVSAHAFQAQLERDDDQADYGPEYSGYRNHTQPINGFGFGLLTGMHVILPHDFKLLLHYELQVIWSDYWQNSGRIHDSGSNCMMSSCSPTGSPFNDFDPIQIVNDPEREQQNIARHLFSLLVSYQF